MHERWCKATMQPSPSEAFVDPQQRAERHEGAADQELDVLAGAGEVCAAGQKAHLAAAGLRRRTSTCIWNVGHEEESHAWAAPVPPWFFITVESSP